MTSQTASKLQSLTRQSPLLASAVIASSMISAEAQAQTIVRDVNIVVDANNGSQFFDLNQDGIDDFILGLNSFTNADGDSIEKADIIGIKRVVFPPQFKNPLELTSFILADEDDFDFALALNPGDTVGASINRPDTRISEIFDSQNPTLGDFTEVGDTGFLGLSIELFNEVTQSVDTHFGFAAIERGSVTITQLGFQTIAGANAVIPGGTPAPIPLPATLPLMISGAAGLLALRRKKKAH